MSKEKKMSSKSKLPAVNTKSMWSNKKIHKKIKAGEMSSTKGVWSKGMAKKGSYTYYFKGACYWKKRMSSAKGRMWSKGIAMNDSHFVDKRTPHYWKGQRSYDNNNNKGKSQNRSYGGL